MAQRYTDVLCGSLSALSAQSSCCIFLWSFQAPQGTQLISPSVRCLPRVWVIFLIYISLSGCLSCPDFFFSLLSLSLFFFFFFVLWFYAFTWRISCLFGGVTLMPTFSRCSVTIVIHVDFFLMCLWDKVAPHLTPPPPSFSCSSVSNLIIFFSHIFLSFHG